MIIKGTYPKFKVTVEPDDKLMFSSSDYTIGEDHHFVKHSPIVFDLEKAGISKDSEHVNIICKTLNVMKESVKQS